MPTRNINLTAQMDRYVEAKVSSGEYANASEVLRAGLRALEKAEQEDQTRLEILRSAPRTGEESGVAGGDVFPEIRERIRQRAEVQGSPE